MPEAEPASRLVYKQAGIDQRKELARQAYPVLWQKIMRAWRNSDGDAAWLTYSANYLLHTGGVLWALDPFSLYSRLKLAPFSDYAADLACLQLVVLSHAHADHLDSGMLAALKHRPVAWVVPGFMLDRVVKPLDLPPSRVIVPRTGQPIRFGGLVLTPFEARHLHAGGGVPEMGYLAEFNGRRWLFPGDTRDYTPGGIPSFENLDGAFAHLWLGKGRALDERPPELDAFCQFFTDLKPGRVVVTHLDEFGRDANDLWDEHHYRMVETRLSQQAPGIRVLCARMGDRVEL